MAINVWARVKFTNGKKGSKVSGHRL